MSSALHPEKHGQQMPLLCRGEKEKRENTGENRVCRWSASTCITFFFSFSKALCPPVHRPKWLQAEEPIRRKFYILCGLWEDEWLSPCCLEKQWWWSLHHAMPWHDRWILHGELAFQSFSSKFSFQWGPGNPTLLLWTLSGKYLLAKGHIS